MEHEGNLCVILLGLMWEQYMIFLIASIVEKRVIHHSNSSEVQTRSFWNVKKQDIIKIFEKTQTQQRNVAHVANNEDEYLIFVATCYVTRNSSNKVLIDSGCTLHDVWSWSVQGVGYFNNFQNTCLQVFLLKAKVLCKLISILVQMSKTCTLYII